MSVILVSSIVRNEARFLDRYHAQLKALVAAMPQHQFLLSIAENDSDDGSAAKLNALDWTFTAAHQIATARLRTPHFIGGKHPIRTELLARARNQSLFGCPPLLNAAHWVLSLEPDVSYTTATLAQIIDHEQHYGRRFDIFTGKSTHVGSSRLYDSWGSRPKAEHTDWCDGDRVEDRGLESMWTTYNCAALYRADAIRAGHTFGGVNPRTGQPDCDTSVICERFRAAGFNEIYWDTRLEIPHDT